MKPKQILLVDDEESLRRVTQLELEDLGFSVSTVADGPEALNLLATAPFQVVITDLKMPGMSGMDLLRRIRNDYPETAVIMITAFGSIEGAVEAMKNGAVDYITKPIDIDELVILINRALDHQELVEEVRVLRSNIDQKYGFEQIIGRSDPLMFVLDMASRAAQTDSTVLIHGETGTGKELLARAVHFNSRRAAKAFITINCGAIPRDLLESELFGHMRGSFTGALSHKQGKVEAADGGTLFLDEIGEMSMELQVKMLRMIQEGEIEKIGTTAPLKVDVRIIAATHRNLQAMIEDGTFREDLYYRLSVIPLTLPPLRERSADIPELVQHFFLKARQKVGRPDLVLPPALIPYFQRYSWPGNIRELQNIIERITVLSRGNEITVADLPEALRKQATAPDAVSLELNPGGISLEGIERDLIVRALEKFSGNQTQAARYLDISRKALIYRMEKHGIR
ncbi:MAG TPA: sigma-54 dependent transcriptional regulator [Bryobacteraceae bacterium]|nr:sigma-54 dependent transcriptional regulator [Bryobacteraceae bacterium]